MLRRLPLILVVISAAAGVQAADWEVRIELPKTVFVQGEPVLAVGTVTNVAGRTLILAIGEPDGFRGSFSLWRSDGQPGPACADRETIDPLGYDFEEAAPGWNRTWRRNINCRAEPGEYLARFAVSSEGPYVQAGSDPQDSAIDTWSGRAESETVTLRIVEPAGEDLLAFDAYQGDPAAHSEATLESHPTSTYAGYAALLGGPWDLDPVAELEIRGVYLRTAEQDPAALPQMLRLESEQEQLSRERARLLAEYLEARPDFVYADFMRLELATRLAYLGRYEESARLCRRLQSTARRQDEAARAGELLRYLAQNGWIERRR